MKNLLLVLVTLIMVISCKKEYSTISAKIEDDDGAMYILKNNYTGKKDSLILKNGEFTHNVKVEEPTYFVIYSEDKKRYEYFYVEKNSNIKISSNNNKVSALIYFFNIGGGGKVQQEYTDFNIKVDELYNVYKTIDGPPKGSKKELLYLLNQSKSSIMTDVYERFVETYNEIYPKENELTLDYIKMNPKSYVALDLLRGLAYMMPPEELKPFMDNIDVSLKTTPSALKIEEVYNKLMSKPRVGALAPNFTQNDVNDKPVKLSDEYNKGKYLLIDFWASWCGPCREENPNVVEAFEKFNKKGFNILGVSLDTKSKSWKKAIENDNLNWTQVSDLNGYDNVVAELYAVTSIPSNYLLDNDGKIIAKDLYGDALKNELETLFAD